MFFSFKKEYFEIFFFRKRIFRTILFPKKEYFEIFFSKKKNVKKRMLEKNVLKKV